MLGLVGRNFNYNIKVSLFSKTEVNAMSNAMMVIFPYRHERTWVFDDRSAGLVREPFVSGIPEMIDALVKDIPQAEKGFRLLFSANPFPGYQAVLIWLAQEYGGN
jgi:hypothetical protein